MIKFVLPGVVQFQGQILKYFFSSNFYHLYYTRLSLRCLYTYQQLLQYNSRSSGDVKRERRNKSRLRCTAICTCADDCDYT